MQFDQFKRREFITLLGGAAAWSLSARAQQLKVARIGVLVLTNADGQSLTRELRLGLRDLGYSEGQSPPKFSGSGCGSCRALFQVFGRRDVDAREGRSNDEWSLAHQQFATARLTPR